jgi:hypothetical protein
MAIMPKSEKQRSPTGAGGTLCLFSAGESGQRRQLYTKLLTKQMIEFPSPKNTNQPLCQDGSVALSLRK